MEARRNIQRNLNKRTLTLKDVDGPNYRSVSFKPVKERSEYDLYIPPLKRFEIEYTDQISIKFNATMRLNDLYHINRRIREYDKAIDEFEAEIASCQYRIDQNIIKINCHKDLRNRLIAKRLELMKRDYLFYDFQCDVSLATLHLLDGTGNNIKQLTKNFVSLADDLMRNHQFSIYVDKVPGNNKYSLDITKPKTTLCSEVIKKIHTLKSIFNMLNEFLN